VGLRVEPTVQGTHTLSAEDALRAAGKSFKTANGPTNENFCLSSNFRISLNFLYQRCF
jgi:hypothetical protein